MTRLIDGAAENPAVFLALLALIALCAGVGFFLTKALWVFGRTASQLTILVIAATVAGFLWNLYALHDAAWEPCARRLPFTSEVFLWLCSRWPIVAFILGVGAGGQTARAWMREHPLLAGWVAVAAGHALWVLA